MANASAIAVRVATDSSGHDGAPVISEVEGRYALEALGLAVPRGAVAVSEDDAVAIAGGLRAPLVLKVSEPAVAHKGRIGGVEIGIRAAWLMIGRSKNDA